MRSETTPLLFFPPPVQSQRATAGRQPTRAAQTAGSQTLGRVTLQKRSHSFNFILFQTETKVYELYEPAPTLAGVRSEGQGNVRKEVRGEEMRNGLRSE